jgi:tetratricopeptide (TPR) repeat protein
MPRDIEPRVCLSMIVRNESAVIGRCLASALPLIDAAVICDTGSTDSTAALAETYLEARGVPARIRTHAWENFGANRTAAIREGEAFVAALGWRLDHTYWLFLDADLELIQSQPFDRRSLSADAVAFEQRAGWLSYWNLRLARASLAWSAVGRTHEHYVSPAMPRLDRATHSWIRDHGDGGSKRDKFTRDIAWLTDQLAETPNDPRALFYLAQSYLATGDAAKALVLYRRRLAAGGTPAETWYAQLSIGRILAESNHLEAATSALLGARRLDPDRAEPLYELARLHRRHGRCAEAVAFAREGVALDPPAGPTHFLHRDVYEYQLDMELARAAHGTPHADRGFEACDRVARSRAAPPDAVAEARRLNVAYAEPMRDMRCLALAPTLGEGYRACNPSLVRMDEGYLVICRAVNYEQRRLRYRSLDADGVFRTRNVLMRLDRSFRVVRQDEVAIDSPALRHGRVQGLEDCRLLVLQNRVFFTCATADRHPSGHVHQSLCEVLSDGRIASHRPLVGRFDGAHQKNWLPFAAADGSLYAIHSYDPLTVLGLRTDTGEYDVRQIVDCTVNSAVWRGSAGPIPWGHGTERRWLAVVHEVVHRQGPDQGWERVYLHRFVEWDTGFRVRRLSRPFVFAHKGVEFACGMAFDHDDAHLIVAFGVEDKAAYLGRMPLARVEAMLDQRPRP